MLDFEDFFNEESAAVEPQRNSRGRLPGDEHAIVVFEKKAMPDIAASNREGRPMTMPVDCITISGAGDLGLVTVSKVRDEHKKRFPVDWENYLNKRSVAQSGTPLEAWPILGVDQVANLKYMKIFTVDALADISDTTAARTPGMLELKKRARAFIDATKEEAIASKSAETALKLDQLEAERNAAKAEAEVMKQQLAELTALVKASKKKGNETE